MSRDYNRMYQEDKQWFEERLKEVFPNSLKTSRQNYGIKAMEYSLQAGGKRIRPIALLETAKAFGVGREEVLPYCLSIEMIHTYSLIHDDLPSMDNDDLRRGLATNHKVFGEAFAILAGDALLNYAYETMLADCVLHFSQGRLRASELIARSSGIYGMVGGQVLDIQLENQSCDEETLTYIHSHKTGALLSASVLAGALIGDANEEELFCLRNYAEDIGLAFQITDDLLDVIGDVDLIGKNTGVDSNKNTFPHLFGVEKSFRRRDELTNRAISHLRRIDRDLWFMEELALEMTKRKW
ncbi:MAG: polyprenyl synthetase family protein [Filifactor alocis]|nr:polyprenyl synthetase family protein [Filifactor alocis]